MIRNFPAILIFKRLFLKTFPLVTNEPVEFEAKVISNSSHFYKNNQPINGILKHIPLFYLFLSSIPRFNKENRIDVGMLSVALGNTRMSTT